MEAEDEAGTGTAPELALDPPADAETETTPEPEAEAEPVTGAPVGVPVEPWPVDPRASMPAAIRKALGEMTDDQVDDMFPGLRDRIAEFDRQIAERDPAHPYRRGEGPWIDPPSIGWAVLVMRQESGEGVVQVYVDEGTGRVAAAFDGTRRTFLSGASVHDRGETLEDDDEAEWEPGQDTDQWETDETGNTVFNPEKHDMPRRRIRPEPRPRVPEQVSRGSLRSEPFSPDVFEDVPAVGDRVIAARGARTTDSVLRAFLDS